MHFPGNVAKQASTGARRATHCKRRKAGWKGPQGDKMQSDGAGAGRKAPASWGRRDSRKKVWPAKGMTRSSANFHKMHKPVFSRETNEQTVPAGMELYKI